MFHFIVFEGIDGVGTTTVSKWLTQSLTELGLTTAWYHGPTDGKIGTLAKEGEYIHHKARALLYVADRVQQEELELKEANTDVVICDRYVWSNLAYQSYWVDYDWLVDKNSGYTEPDITFLLDAPLKVAEDRVWGRGIPPDEYEVDPVQKHVKETYLKLYYTSQNAYFIDANRDISSVQNSVLDITKYKLGK